MPNRSQKGAKREPKGSQKGAKSDLARRGVEARQQVGEDRGLVQELQRGEVVHACEKVRWGSGEDWVMILMIR